MSAIFRFFIVMALSSASWAESAVTVPWQEFKALYAESIENGLKTRYAKDEPKPLYSIDNASYQLQVKPDGASGQALIEGRVLRGRPEPFLLFARDIAITRVDEVQGGMLYSDSEGYKLLLQGEEPFRLRCAIAVAVQEGEHSPFFSFAIPSAVKNVLKLDLAEGLRLVRTPGLRHGDGSYYFAPAESLSVHFTQQAQKASPPSVDIFSRIVFKGGKFRIASFFAPTQAVSGALEIDMPAGRLLQTTLKTAWLNVAGNRISVSLPAGWRELFRIDYEIEADEERGALQLSLPSVTGNQGREGEFQIEQPAGADVLVSGANLQTQIAASRLPEKLRKAAAVLGTYGHNSANEPLTLEVQSLAVAAQSDIVLDAVYVYTSYTENGTALSILRLELPEQSGGKLRLQPVPGAEIWSLSVNGQARTLYQQTNGNWVIPLAVEGVSLIELAYLQKGARLGLKGRLALALPALGIAARRLNVAVALAERVELIAMEGELEPVDGKSWPRVKGFNGRPYFFSQPFYRGDAQSAAIYYKEPLQQNTGEQS